MMQRPWIVALISTDYDLSDERNTVIEFLQHYGMEVSAFEKPDFPVFEEIHSHENCIQVLKRADMAILLIKKRYGGKYYCNQNISITQAEYESLNIPTIVLVNKRTWDERASYRRQLKKSGLTEQEFAESGQYDPGDIEIETLRFIDNIQKSYYQSGKSNWINFWNSIEDLERSLKDVMCSRSITIIHEIVQGQIREVKNRRTSTGLSMPLGDVFDRGYYIEPEYKVQAGNIIGTNILTEGINEKLNKGESCLILGEAGAGKTTLTAKCFLDLSNTLNSHPFLIPAYVWLKSMNIDNSFSVQEFLELGCERYLHKKPYPFFCKDSCSFVFFLDGFDELAEKLTKEELQKLYATEMFHGPLMLTSRMQYADHYLNNNEFDSRFGCLIKLTDWTESTAQNYIRQFCTLQGKDMEFEKCINSLLLENDDLHDVLKSPLLITILLYVIERSRMEIPETIRSRTQLFDECLDKLAEREIERRLDKQGQIPTNQELVDRWAFFAWMIYENRLNGENRMSIVDADARINNIMKGPAMHMSSEIYEVIFDINGEYAFGAFHEQFLEFLVARTLAHACKNKTEPYPEFLKYVMRPEINRYFRGIVVRMPKTEQHTIVENIKDQYWQCVGKTSKNDILKRVHAVYHLSRMIPKDDSEDIDRIFNVETEKAVLLSIYFGVIKKGNLEREGELFNLLNEEDDYSNANRGYHLAYYDTMSSQITLPYKDDSSIDWDGPLRAFQRHFSSLDKEHFYLRRIDLVTMRQFMEFRGKRDPLTDNILEQMEKMLSIHPQGVDLGFQKLIEEEFLKLKKTYGSYA